MSTLIGYKYIIHYMANLTKEQRAEKEAIERAELEAKIKAELEAYSI